MAATNTAEPARKGRLIRRGAVMARSLMRLHPRAYLLATLGGAIYGVALVASSYALGLVVDHLVIPRFEQGAIAAGTAVAGLVALFAIGMTGASATLLRRRMTVLARVRSDASLREAVVRRYQALPYEYHQRNPTGELLAHANVDPEAAADMPSRIPHAVGVLVLFFVAGVWIFVTDPLLAAVGLVVVPALVALNAFFQRRVETPTTIAQDRLGELSAVAHGSFDGALVVKVLGREESETARFGAVAEKLRDANIEVFKREATFDVLLESIPALTIIALLVCGAFRVDSGAVSPGTLFSFINLFSLLTYPLRTIGYVLGNVPRSMAGYDRVRRVLDEEVSAPARGTSALPAGPLDLRADGVTFAHSGGNRVLDELSFAVKGGTTLAVAGPTGCGKTTLVFLLAGLLRPSAGSVRLGGADVSDLAPGDVTRACATVLQDPFLFAGTIEENILLGHEAADGEVAAALRLAGVAEFVDSLPHGTRTTVGERGVTLSGGQRQRVALARALVRSPRLLILDDATSAVDPTTEDRILRGIAAGLHGVTKVVVASRPSTLALADSVLYLEKNRPACLGTHEWLLARVPGYQELVRAYESEGSRA